MNDYLEFEILNSPNQLDLISALRIIMPNTIWRSGDSDSQGKYIKAYFDNGIDLAIWLEDSPDQLIINTRRFNKIDKNFVNELINDMAKALNAVQSGLLAT